MAVAAGIVGDAQRAARRDPNVQRQSIGVAVPVQNVGEFEANAGPVPGHRRSTKRNEIQNQTIERALGRTDRMGGDLG
jgi:hypothetical protein